MLTLKDLKPLTCADVTVGTTYIALCCALDTSLSVSLITPLTMWDARGFFQARVTYGDPAQQSSYEIQKSMGDLGVLDAPRRHHENYHRLFAYSEDAYQLLLQLCKEQRNVEWLEYLGVADPGAVIEFGKRRDKAISSSMLISDALDALVNRDC